MTPETFQVIRGTEGLEAAKLARRAVYAEAVRLYAEMPIREIAQRLDTTISFVQGAIRLAGLPLRPIWAAPGDSPRRHKWPRKGRISLTRQFTAEEVISFRAQYRAGVSPGAMTRRVCRSTVLAAIRGRSYAEVPGAVTKAECDEICRMRGCA
jgi:hypothetical protein